MGLGINNYGFLDVTWTLSIGLLALLDAIFGASGGSRRVAFAAVGVVWSLRLGLFVLIRVLRHHPKEDVRYRSLRERWPSPLQFLLFFELQAFIAMIFSAPFLLAAFARGQSISIFEVTGLAIAALGICGESLADWQSAVFKKGAGAKSAILDKGLWRYSRHPNYFFEILVWLGFAIASLDLPWSWLAVVCPILISYFLLRVTGIPLTEKHSIERHGEAYRAYQRSTSALIPWPRKRLTR